jgi:hypothetical protein
MDDIRKRFLKENNCMQRIMSMVILTYTLWGKIPAERERENDVLGFAGGLR